jgi:hypothetical protein
MTASALVKKPSLKRSRTFTRAEMEDAARLAELHGLSVRFEPSGALVMQPSNHPLDNAAEDSAESELARWRAKREAAGRPHR